MGSVRSAGFVAAVLLVAVGLLTAGTTYRRGRARPGGPRPTESPPTESPPTDSPSRTAGRRRPGGRWLLAVGAVVVPPAVVASFTSSTGFFSDDFANFRDAQLNELSFRYLIEPTSAHFAPGHKLVDWLFYRSFGLDVPVAMALSVLGLAATLFVLYRLVHELCGAGPAPAILTFLYGMSTVQVFSIEWFASAVDRVPATLLTFASLLGYVRHHRSRSKGWLAVSVLAMAAAVTFYVKPVLIPLYLVLLRVFVLDPEVPVRRAFVDALREWRVWLLYAVPSAAFAVAYLRTYDEGGEIYPASLAQFGRYLADLWFRVVSPSVFGLFLSADGGPSATARIAIQLVLAGAVVWCLVRIKGAWRVCLFFGVAFLANALMVGLTRIGLFNARTTAYILYYNLEATFLVVLAAAGLLRMRRGTPSREPRLRTWWPAVAVGVAGFVVASLVGSHLVSSDRIWVGPHARRYADRIGAALERVRAEHPGAALVDTVVPDYVVYNRAGAASEVFPAFDDRVTFDARDRPLVSVADDGTVRAVTFVAHAGGEAAALLQAGSMTFAGTTPRPTDSGVCFSTGAERALVAYVPPAPINTPAAFSLRYSSAHRQLLVVLVEPAGGGPVIHRFLTLAASADRASVLDLAVPSLQKLYLSFYPDADACLRDLVVGTLVPRP